jgi:hypothetical protein
VGGGMSRGVIETPEERGVDESGPGTTTTLIEMKFV